MRVLIDGYNLLFQSPFVGSGRGPGWLARARHRLISHLHAHLPDEVLKQTTIVFDASQSGKTFSDFQSERGITVLFSRDHPEADDMLEELIRKHSAPKSLLVISSDLRIRRTAKARRAESMDADSFLAELQSERLDPAPKRSGRGLPPNPSPAKEVGGLTQAQVDYWLKEFGQS